MIFFSNPKITSKQLIAPHYQQTVARIQQSGARYVLAIQDQMRLNYTKHLAKTELGRIGKSGKTMQYGLIQHSVLCVTDENEPLGLMDVALFDYEDLDTQTHHHHRAIQDKATRYGLDALAKMRQRLGACSQHIITVADREGDFYELLHALLQANEAFVIRAKHDRYTGHTHRARGEKVRELLEEAPSKGCMTTTIQDVSSREIKEITLTLKAIEVLLPPPNKGKKDREQKNEVHPIKINAVLASNKEHEWVLLTQLPIATGEQIEEIVRIYRSRWHIEDYHKLLKTGYQIDEIYLHSSREALENLITMASVSACRLYWLIYIGRAEPAIKADQLFEDFEWRALYVYFQEKIPQYPPRAVRDYFKNRALGWL